MDKKERKNLEDFIIAISLILGDESNYDEEIKPNLQKLLDLIRR